MSLISNGVMNFKKCSKISKNINVYNFYSGVKNVYLTKICSRIARNVLVSKKLSWFSKMLQCCKNSLTV